MIVAHDVVGLLVRVSLQRQKEKKEEFMLDFCYWL